MPGPPLSSKASNSKLRLDDVNRCRGAVLSRLPQEAIIVSTQATRHYGVSAMELYDDEFDKGQLKVYDASDGKNRAKRVSTPRVPPLLSPFPIPTKTNRRPHSSLPSR